MLLTFSKPYTTIKLSLFNNFNEVWYAGFTDKNKEFIIIIK